MEELLPSVSSPVPPFQATWPLSLSQWSSAFTPPPPSAWWGVVPGPFPGSMGRPWEFNFRPQGPDPWRLPRPGVGTREAGAVVEDAGPGRVEEVGSSAVAELLPHGAGGATTAVAIRGGTINVADVYSNR